MTNHNLLYIYNICEDTYPGKLLEDSVTGLNRNMSSFSRGFDPRHIVHFNDDA